jgi:hypothetical protein
LLALIGGSRFEATRPVEAALIALGLPLGAVIAGVAPLKDASTPLRAIALSVAAAILVLSELGVASALFDRRVPALPLELLAGAALALGVLAVAIEATAARKGMRTRFCGWIGIAAGLGLYLPGHFSFKDALGSVLAALLVAVFVGGGVGLFLGTLAAHLARRS